MRNTFSQNCDLPTTDTFIQSTCLVEAFKDLGFFGNIYGTLYILSYSMKHIIHLKRINKTQTNHVYDILTLIGNPLIFRFKINKLTTSPLEGQWPLVNQSNMYSLYVIIKLLVARRAVHAMYMVMPSNVTECIYIIFRKNIHFCFFS